MPEREQRLESSLPEIRHTHNRFGSWLPLSRVPGALSALCTLDSTGPVYTHRTPTLSTLAKSGPPILAHANSAYGTATDRTVIKHEFGFRLAHICR